MSCCGNESTIDIDKLRKEEPERIGRCEECESETLDGEAVDYCSYSPRACNKCGWSPCDGSC